MSYAVLRVCIYDVFYNFMIVSLNAINGMKANNFFWEVRSFYANAIT